MAVARTGKGSVACIYLSAEKVSEWMEDTVIFFSCVVGSVPGWLCYKILVFQDADR